MRNPYFVLHVQREGALPGRARWSPTVCRSPARPAASAPERPAQPPFGVNPSGVNPCAERLRAPARTRRASRAMQEPDSATRCACKRRTAMGHCAKSGRNHGRRLQYPDSRDGAAFLDLPHTNPTNLDGMHPLPGGRGTSVIPGTGVRVSMWQRAACPARCCPATCGYTQVNPRWRSRYRRRALPTGTSKPVNAQTPVDVLCLTPSLNYERGFHAANRPTRAC